MSKTSVKRVEELAEENAKLRGQLSHIRKVGVFNATSRVLGELFRALMVICPFGFAYLAIHDLAGKLTVASIEASASAKVDAEVDAKVEGDEFWKVAKEILNEHTLSGLLALIGAGGVVYGRRERRLHRDDIERLHSYKEAYEKSKDPKRSSSRLTRRGETRPED